MSIWIVTTGNSDVILKHEKNWGDLYDEVVDDLDCQEFASASPIDPYDKDAGYTVPARVLGLVYGNQPDYYDDLRFPLLDTYSQYLDENKIKLEKIIILLTDQSKIFDQEKRIYEKCPYWQDTETLKPLLEWYFKKYECSVQFAYLKPAVDKKGIDHWEETLSLVEETLNELDYSFQGTVYVSHQAGTPAISSAVQFVSLGKFAKVKFLVSNQYFNDDYKQESKSEAIDSSNYWRGMQIQKAKQLIIAGLPAAAREVLTGIDRINDDAITDLNQMVDLFNIKSSKVKGQEFLIPQATKRIVTALDLIEIFFKQENYIQGIAILNATQETFLKVAILAQVRNINGSHLKLANIIDWNHRGLFIKSQKNLKNVPNLAKPLDILNQYFDSQLCKRYKNEEDEDFYLNNSRQLQLLCELKKEFKPWSILHWSCKYKRNNEEDLRNQLLHNLLGIEKQEVCKYLLGNDDNLTKLFLGNLNPELNEVNQAYIQYVKKPFMKSLKFFGLQREEPSENKLEQKLQQIADSLV